VEHGEPGAVHVAQASKPHVEHSLWQPLTASAVAQTVETSQFML